MTAQRQTHASWASALGSVAVGAAAMYLMDPDRGRRRRAIARDKAMSIAAHGGDLLRQAVRDVQFRMQGLRARRRYLMERDDAPDDLRLIERVRSKLGRVCSHPHALQVGANHGRVTLSGPILASEVDRVLRATQSVRGVIDVEDCLAAHHDATSISSLQGGRPRVARAALLQDHWSPSLRVAALAGGTAVVLAGLRRGGVAGVALAAAGALFATRAACNKPLADMLQAATASSITAGNEPAVEDSVAPPPAQERAPAFDPYSH
jgi:osmotically-inducible protein OsmY